VLRELGRDQAAAAAEDAARRELTALGVVVAEPRPASRVTGDLTRREHEVLRLLATGMSNEEIAAQLVLSVRTVEHHVASIYSKIGVSGRSARVAATAYALAHGLS
jgi:DNA-binding NarL/FixJ family response regulator